jgi:hypothetical protein
MTNELSRKINKSIEKQRRKNLTSRVRRLSRVNAPEVRHCYVCLSHPAISELHHMFKVSSIVDMIAPLPEEIWQEALDMFPLKTVWLCPNHHAMFHAGFERYCDDSITNVLEPYNLTQQEADFLWELFSLYFVSRDEVEAFTKKFNEVLRERYPDRT